MNKKYTTVDENDNVIGAKTRDSLLPSDIYRAAALWIKNSKGESLLARRALIKDHDPGRWGPAVAGTVEEGETYLQNIIKEAEEELGLVGIDPKEGPKYLRRGKHTYFTQWYLLGIDKNPADLKIQEEEVAEVRWFSKEQLLEEFKKHPEEFLESTSSYIHLFA